MRMSVFCRQFCVLYLLFASFWSQAALVVKIKKNKAFVHLEGEEALPGDYYQALDLYGKPQGILKINKVRNGKAIATVIQGRTGINWILEKTNQPTISNLSAPMNSTFPKNILGFSGRGLAQIGSKQKNQVSIQGFGGGASVFFERLHSRHFSSQFLLGLSYSQINQKCKESSRCNIESSGFLKKLSVPEVAFTFFLNANLYNNILFFIGVGGSLASWHNLNNNHKIITRNNFEKIIQPSGHITLGFNVGLQNMRVPVSVSYSKVQAFAEQYEKYFKDTKTSQDYVNLSYLSLNIGVSKDF